MHLPFMLCRYVTRCSAYILLFSRPLLTSPSHFFTCTAKTQYHKHRTTVPRICNLAAIKPNAYASIFLLNGCLKSKVQTKKGTEKDPWKGRRPLGVFFSFSTVWRVTYAATLECINACYGNAWLVFCMRWYRQAFRGAHAACRWLFFLSFPSRRLFLWCVFCIPSGSYVLLERQVDGLVDGLGCESRQFLAFVSLTVWMMDLPFPLFGMLDCWTWEIIGAYRTCICSSPPNSNNLLWPALLSCCPVSCRIAVAALLVSKPLHCREYHEHMLYSFENQETVRSNHFGMISVSRYITIHINIAYHASIRICVPFLFKHEEHCNSNYPSRSMPVAECSQHNLQCSCSYIGHERDQTKNVRCAIPRGMIPSQMHALEIWAL